MRLVVLCNWVRAGSRWEKILDRTIVFKGRKNKGSWCWCKELQDCMSELYRWLNCLPRKEYIGFFSGYDTVFVMNICDIFFAHDSVILEILDPFIFADITLQ